MIERLLGEARATTRWPWFGNTLLPAYGSRTDARASLTWRKSGSASPAMKRSTQHMVPTLPTATTLIAASWKLKRLMKDWYAEGSVATYAVNSSRTACCTSPGG